MTKTLSKNDSNFTKLLSQTITVIGYILAFLGFIFNLGAIFGTIWITDPNYNGYPFANNNWEVTVQAYLVLSTIFSSAGFLAERLIGLSNGGQALKCSIGSSWFCSFICMTVAMSVYTGYTASGQYGYSYSFGWTSSALHFLAGLAYMIL